jgi:23S rRNA pseudoU1915 N3-methylase RlmH
MAQKEGRVFRTAAHPAAVPQDSLRTKTAEFSLRFVPSLSCELVVVTSNEKKEKKKEKKKKNKKKKKKKKKCERFVTTYRPRRHAS